MVTRDIIRNSFAGAVLALGGLLLPFTATSSVPALAARGPVIGATASMAIPRVDAQAVRLQDGRVLMIGGQQCDTVNPSSCRPTNRVEIYDPATGTWSAAAPMAYARVYFTATVLHGGQVLVTGGLGAEGQPNWGATLNPLSSAELYDPTSGQWTTLDDMQSARVYQTATLLPDGDVLIAGGTASDGPTAELYDYEQESFYPTGEMITDRIGQAATLLPDGRVLVAGGLDDNNQPLASAELYDPAGGAWSPAAPMPMALSEPTSALTNAGRVLVAGGEPVQNGSESTLNSTYALYDPGANSWSTRAMVTPRTRQAETVLSNGDILIAGGSDAYGLDEAGTEIVDDTHGLIGSGVAMTEARDGATATVLADGRVLIAGGVDCHLTSSSEVCPTLNSAEILPAAPAGIWTPAAPLGTAVDLPGMTTLPDGTVLAAGGSVGLAQETNAAARFDAAANRWQSVPMPDAQETQRQFLLGNGDVVDVGGTACDANGCATVKNLDVYSPSTNSWSTRQLQVGVDNYGVALLSSGRLFIAGGTQSGNERNFAWTCDIATGSCDPFHSLTYLRNNPEVVALSGGRILVLYGQPCPPSSICNPVTSTSALPEMWTGRAWVATSGAPDNPGLPVVLADGDVLFAGATDSNGNLIHTTYLFHPDSDSWSEAAPLPDGPLPGFSLTLLPTGQVMAAGGVGSDLEPSSQTWLYDPAANQWTRTADLVLPRSAQGMAVLQDGSVLAAGGEQTPEACPDSILGCPTASVERYVPLPPSPPPTPSVSLSSLPRTQAGLPVIAPGTTLAGSTVPNAAIAVQLGESRLCSATADGSGFWSCSAGSLPDGTYGLLVSATSAAGTTASDPVSVLFDGTSPSTTARPPAGYTLGSWSNHAITLTLAASDGAGSGVASTFYRINGGAWTKGTSVSVAAPADHSGDGTFTVDYYSVDLAGNREATQSVTVKIDTTAPVITYTGRTAANAQGWNRTDVTVGWSCDDTLSGAAAQTVSRTLTSEGRNQSATGTCSDLAGNTASDTQTGINIDRTPPTLTFTGGTQYTVDQTVTITCAASDPALADGSAGSGVASTAGCGNGQAQTEVSQSAAALFAQATTSQLDPTGTVATFTASGSATDRADNTRSGSTTYTVALTNAGLQKTVTQLVTNANTAQPLTVSLQQAQQSAAGGNLNAAANQVGAFLNKVKSAQQSGKISSDAASILTALGTHLQSAYAAGHNV